MTATQLRNPDFAAYARAFGGHGETVEETAEFLPAFERALASGLASIVHVKIDPEAIPALKDELTAKSRTRRLRAITVAQAATVTGVPINNAKSAATEQADSTTIAVPPGMMRRGMGIWTGTRREGRRLSR